MDTITVIFTGLMIFDVTGRTVYLPKADHHVLTVTPNPSGRPVESIAFKGLAKGQSRFHSFPILNLADHAGVMLKINPDGVKAAIAVKFKGEFKGDDDHAECRLEGNERPTWTSVKWTVEIDKGESPSIVLNGGAPIPLKPGDRVSITNDDPAAIGSHLPMYSIAVKDLDDNPVTIAECVGAKTLTVHNPLTCPPVMLK